MNRRCAWHCDGSRSPAPKDAGAGAGCCDRGVPACRCKFVDINAIVEAAGVARSTFYFHFPTKEHVLLELIRRDEDYLGEELSRFLDTRRALPAVLNEIIRLVVALENRWGASLFGDVISLTSHRRRPKTRIETKHPMFVLLAAEIERARIRGELYDDADAYDSAAFFLIGLHAQLISARESGSGRDEVLKKFAEEHPAQPPALNQAARLPPSTHRCALGATQPAANDQAQSWLMNTTTESPDVSSVEAQRRRRHAIGMIVGGSAAVALFALEGTAWPGALNQPSRRRRCSLWTRQPRRRFACRTSTTVMTKLSKRKTTRSSR